MTLNKKNKGTSSATMILTATIISSLVIVLTLFLVSNTSSTQLRTATAPPTCTDRSVSVKFGPYTGTGPNPIYAFQRARQRMELAWNMNNGYRAQSDALATGKLDCTVTGTSTNPIPTNCVNHGPIVCTPINLSQSLDCKTRGNSSIGYTVTCSGRVKCKQKCIHEIEVPAMDEITPCTEADSCSSPAKMTLEKTVSAYGPEVDIGPLSGDPWDEAAQTAALAHIAAAKLAAENAAKSKAHCNNAVGVMQDNEKDAMGHGCSRGMPGPSCGTPSSISCSSGAIKAPPENNVLQYRGTCSFKCECAWACQITTAYKPEDMGVGGDEPVDETILSEPTDLNMGSSDEDPLDYSEPTGLNMGSSDEDPLDDYVLEGEEAF